MAWESSCRRKAIRKIERIQVSPFSKGELGRVVAMARALQLKVLLLMWTSCEQYAKDGNWPLKQF
jgi:hypothetical protein